MCSSTSRWVAAAVMTLTAAACGDGNGTIPTATAPTPMVATAPTPTPPPGSTFALFGVVSEMTANGIVPVVGVQVEEYHSHQFAPTDANGFYRFSAVAAGRIGVGFEKEGYQSNRSAVTVNGDTRFDLEAIRR